MTNRRLLVYALVGILLGSGLAVAASSVFITPQSGTVPYGVSDGPTVSLSGDLNTTGVWTESGNPNLVELNTSAGNLTAIAESPTDFTVDSVYLENNQWFNVTSITAGATWIEVYSPDSPRFDTRGDVNELSVYENIQLDDDQTDFWYSGTDGGTVSVRLYNLPANTEIAALDPNSKDLLDANSSDSNGDITYDLPASSHNVELETSDGAPIIDNASPTGEITDPPEYLEFDLSDVDFPGDNVSVNITFEGNTVYSESGITQNKTINTNNFTVNELGRTYNWSVEATDAYGQTTIQSYSFELPGFLYVYSESDPSQLVDNVTVNATITGSGETVDLDTVSDGTINMSGLPADGSYVFTLTADGYHPREVYVTDLFEQQTVFMLNTSVQSVQNQITITDRTGEYDEGTVILVDRVINTTLVGNMSDEGPQWVTIGGDRLGAGGFYSVDLQEDARYRFRVTSEESGNTRILSEYTAKQSGEINLQIGSIRYSIGDQNTYEWDVSSSNETTGRSIRFAYNDHENLTDSVSVEIRTRENNTLVDSEDFVTGPYGEVVFTTTVSDAEWVNNSYKVEWSASRDGETISGSRLISGKATLDLPLSNAWKSIAYAGAILVLAFLVGAGAGVAPALVTIGLASGFAVYIGIAPASLGFGSTILVLALGAIYMLNVSRV